MVPKDIEWRLPSDPSIRVKGFLSKISEMRVGKPGELISLSNVDYGSAYSQLNHTEYLGYTADFVPWIHKPSTQLVLKSEEQPPKSLQEVRSKFEKKISQCVATLTTENSEDTNLDAVG